MGGSVRTHPDIGRMRGAFVIIVPDIQQNSDIAGMIDETAGRTVFFRDPPEFADILIDGNAMDAADDAVQRIDDEDAFLVRKIKKGVGEHDELAVQGIEIHLLQGPERLAHEICFQIPFRGPEGGP